MTDFRLSGKTILIISPEPWDHVFVSKHHYAVHLANAGNHIWFLNPPGKSLAVRPSGYKRVMTVDYPGFVPGLRLFPGFLQRTMMRSMLRSLERVTGVAFDVIWSFDNSVFYDFRIFSRETVTISHIVDLNQDFNTRTAARTAAICLCTTDLIQKRLLKYNRHAYKINHGFNAVEAKGTAKMPGTTGRIRAMYCGNLNMRYIDWQILFRIVAYHPTVDFVFVGPGFEDLRPDNRTVEFKGKLKSLSNVFSVGKVESREIPAYLAEADILLVSYQAQHHADQANPHKMMEYLGSGKVVVATKTLEYEHCHPLVVMSDPNSELPDIFADVAANLKYYNSQVLCEKRIAMAMDNTYDMQISRIEQIIRHT